MTLAVWEACGGRSGWDLTHLGTKIHATVAGTAHARTTPRPSTTACGTEPAEVDEAFGALGVNVGDPGADAAVPLDRCALAAGSRLLSGGLQCETYDVALS